MLKMIQGIMFGALLLTGACGKKSSSDSDSSNVLVGTWQSKCVANTDGTYTLGTITVTASQFTRNVGFYSDASCTTTANSGNGAGITQFGNLTAAYSIVGPASAPAGAEKLNLGASSLILLYTIFSISGNNLTMGLTTAAYDGSSDLKRPIALDTSLVYIKKS